MDPIEQHALIMRRRADDYALHVNRLREKLSAAQKLSLRGRATDEDLAIARDSVAHAQSILASREAEAQAAEKDWKNIQEAETALAGFRAALAKAPPAVQRKYRNGLKSPGAIEDWRKRGK